MRLHDRPAAAVHAALTAQLSGVVASCVFVGVVRPSSKNHTVGLALLGVGDADTHALAIARNADERLTAMLDVRVSRKDLPGLVSRSGRILASNRGGF